MLTLSLGGHLGQGGHLLQAGQHQMPRLSSYSPSLTTTHSKPTLEGVWLLLFPAEVIVASPASASTWANRAMLWQVPEQSQVMKSKPE